MTLDQRKTPAESPCATATSAIYSLMRCRDTSPSDKRIQLRSISQAAMECVEGLEKQEAQRAHEVRGAH